MMTDGLSLMKHLYLKNQPILRIKMNFQAL